MAFRVELSSSYMTSLFLFYGDTNAEYNTTGKPLEERSSDPKESGVSSPPTGSSDDGSEQFELEEQKVPEQIAEEDDESLRHALNRSPFNSNEEIVMVLKIITIVGILLLLMS